MENIDEAIKGLRKILGIPECTNGLCFICEIKKESAFGICNDTKCLSKLSNLESEQVARGEYYHYL